MCPNTEFFLVCIFPHYFITSYLSVFSPNAGKCGPEKTSYWDTFHDIIKKLYHMTMTISRYWEIISNKTKNLFRTWKIKQRKLLLSNKDLKTWIFVKNTMDVLYKLYKWYQIVQRVSFRRGISYFIKIIPCTSMLSQ